MSRLARWLMIGLAWATVAGCASQAQVGDPPAAFDAVLIELFGTSDLARYRYDIERRAEQLIIECMNEAGYEFQVRQPLPPEPTQAELASRDFAETDGFGIISTFREWIDTTDLVADQSDPNAPYLTTLTAAEIEQYLITLDGPPAEPGQVKTDRGCRGSGSMVAYRDWEDFIDTLPQQGGLGEERDTHPDWTAARKEWAECMDSSGFDYSEPDAIRQDVRRLMNESVQSIYPDSRLPIVFDDGDWVLDPEVEALLDGLQAFEVDAAIANLDCNEPLADRFDAVEREVQQAFVDRYRATIDELLARR